VGSSISSKRLYLGGDVRSIPGGTDEGVFWGGFPWGALIKDVETAGAGIHLRGGLCRGMGGPGSPGGLAVSS